MLRWRRGIFLISILFLSVVVAMFATAALALAPAGMQRTLFLSKRQAAERAVKTGLEYAVARIRATPGGQWRAQDPQQLQFEGMTVREGEGQVEGWIREGEMWSRFRMSFNFQDGNDGLDFLDDPASPFSVPVGLSFNNLSRNQEGVIPATTATGSADTSAPARFAVPPHCLLLSLEGACGQAWTAGTSAPGDFYGTPSRFRAETLLQLSNTGLTGLDSVASSSGDLRFQVRHGNKVSFKSVGGGPGRLRTRTQLGVVDENGQGALLESSRGEIRTPGDGNQVGLTQVAANIERQNENAGDAFYHIPLDSAPQVGADAVSLPAGIYEVDLVQNQPVVKFYEMTYAEYKAHRLAGTLTGGNPVSLDPSIQLSVLPRTGDDIVEVRLTKDVTVEAGTLNNLAIVPAKGAFQEADVPAIQPPPPASAAVGYLVELANKIQVEMETAGSQIVNQNVATLNNLTPSSTFADVLESYGGGPTGNINTAGVSLAYNPSGIPVVNQFELPWDGLSEGQYQYGSLQLAQHLWSNLGSSPTNTPTLEAFMGGPIPTGFGQSTPPDVGFSGGDPGPTEPASTSGLSVQELKIRLEAEDQANSVTLRGPGDTVLAGMLEGKGGAVVSAGNLSLLGNGVDLQASADATSGINLYGCGDILIDGFAFDDSSSRYNNISLKGVMYSWGQITVNAGRVGSSLPWGRFDLTGAMVAFGRDPSSSGTASARNILVTARNARLTFDPVYLSNLLDSPVSPDSRFVVRAYHQH